MELSIGIYLFCLLFDVLIFIIISYREINRAAGKPLPGQGDQDALSHK